MADHPDLLKTLLSILEDDKAIDTVVINVRDQTSVTDYMVITSGRSTRHNKAIANHALEKMKASGHPSLTQHGLESADWVLIDFSDFILHVMSAESRTFYDLEGLWKTA